MKKIIIILLLFANSTLLIAQTAMNTFQFWFDNDYANAQSGILTNGTFVSNISTNTISYGEHTIHYRAKDSNDKWSAVVSQKFIKPSLLNQYEYWFDNDYNSKVQAATSNVEFIQVNTLANMAAISNGDHIIHFRSKNEYGKWSGVVSQNVIKISKIDAYEYWFDDDYINKVSQTLPSPVSSLDINQLIATSTLNGTHHTIHYRVHKQDGTWSAVLSQAFHKKNHIVAYEYWFNNNYNSKIYQSIVPSEIFSLTPVLDVSSSSLGSNTLFIRFKDENGTWGQVITEGFCHNTGDSSIHLKLFLQGYYTGAGTMTTVLMNQGIGSSLLSTDSIDVQLRNVNSPYQIVANSKVELKTDGTTKVDFPNSFNGLYYLTVKHRNSIETWSAYPIYKDNCPLLYDFTTNDNLAYGSNMIEMEPNIWAIYSGDLNQDENIDLLDVSNLENDINDFQFGYFGSDINGDGNVDLLDSPLLEVNVNNFIFSIHP